MVGRPRLVGSAGQGRLEGLRRDLSEVRLSSDQAKASAETIALLDDRKQIESYPRCSFTSGFKIIQLKRAKNSCFSVLVTYGPAYSWILFVIWDTGGGMRC